MSWDIFNGMLGGLAMSNPKNNTVIASTGSTSISNIPTNTTYTTTYTIPINGTYVLGISNGTNYHSFDSIKDYTKETKESIIKSVCGEELGNRVFKCQMPSCEKCINEFNHNFLEMLKK